MPQRRTFPESPLTFRIILIAALGCGGILLALVLYLLRPDGGLQLPLMIAAATLGLECLLAARAIRVLPCPGCGGRLRRTGGAYPCEGCGVAWRL